MTRLLDRSPGRDARIRLYRHQWVFFGLSIAIPWALWIGAGILSRRPEQTPATVWGTTGLALAGLCAPIGVAAMLIRGEQALRDDIRARLTGLRGAPAWAVVAAIALLPTALLVATVISIALGGPTSQFAWKGVSTVMVGSIPGWIAVGLAPVLEELAWHSYGTDSLVSRWTVWRSTLVFGVYWAAWHIPLAGIKGSYQAEVTDVGPLASANFLLSVFPLMILMNWLYYRSGRNVWIAVLVHLSANYGNELLQTAPDTKVVQTVLLLIPCAWVLWHDRSLFFTRPEQQ